MAYKLDMNFKPNQKINEFVICIKPSVASRQQLIFSNLSAFVFEMSNYI